MRLSLIFLVVLATSVLITSLAAWGITYGTSYSRVTTMSSEFSALAKGVLDEFSAYVTELLQSNSKLVDTILTEERVSGEARIQQTKTDMITSIGTLVNYTSNATVQSQQQMNTVVDTFAALMGKVVGDFRGLLNGYSAQLRAAMAAKASGALITMGNTRVNALLRHVVSQRLGLLNLSRTPYDPIELVDCRMLDVVCAHMAELGPYAQDRIVLILATGRSYFCSPSMAWISLRSANGSLYNEDLVTWLPYSSSVPASAQRPTVERCVFERPDVVERVGQGCPASVAPNCQCGRDQRCTPAWQIHIGDTVSDLRSTNTTINTFGVPTSSITISLVNASTPVPSLAAVVTDDNDIVGIEYYLASFGASPSTVMAIFSDDAQFSSVGYLGRKCAANETAPGDPSLPLFLALRICDAGLLWVAQYIAANRILPPWVTLQNNGVVWDIFPVSSGILRYYFILGTLLSEINAPIDATNAQATTELSAVRTQQLSLVAASGTATRAYVAAVGASNVAATQAMEVSFLAQIQALDSTSRATLAASQQSSAVHVQQLTTQQATQIDALKAKHLNAMSTTAGWTIAVVFGILLGVLLSSAWGTIRITLSLLNIIDLMEDVADMKVENLEVPESSSVEEVARIQTAFQVLIARLAEYKSYIPAGLFEQQAEATAKAEGVDLEENSEEESVSAMGSARQVLQGPRAPAKRSSGINLPGRNSVVIAVRRSSKMSCATSRAGRRPVPAGPVTARRNVVVLAVNVQGFMEVLGHGNEGLSKSVFNDYITVVHEAVSLGRGNIDCILGDQVFATFNAHIPCSDSSVAAVLAALEIKSKSSVKLADRLKYQVGVSFGAAFVSSVGYTKFKSMVTVGSPMKVAALLSHLPRFDSGAIVVDSALEQRVKFLYKLIPVELMHLPNMKSFQQSAPKSQPVFTVVGKRDMKEDEWMYQIRDGQEDGKHALMDWIKTFDELSAAKTVQEGQARLQEFLAAHPHDDVALRLRDRLPLWIPSLGIPQ